MADAQDIVAFWNDHEVMQYIGDGTWGGDIYVVKNFLHKTIASYAKDPGYGDWAVVDNHNNHVIGMASLEIVPNSHEIEAGYMLRRDYWGRGFGTEILSGLIDYGFYQLRCDKIMGICLTHNQASMKVMEKCGMHRDGQHVYYGLPHYKYVIEYFHDEKVKKAWLKIQND